MKVWWILWLTEIQVRVGFKGSDTWCRCSGLVGGFKRFGGFDMSSFVLSEFEVL